MGGEGPAAGAREQGRPRDPGRAAVRRHGQERRQAGAEGRRRRRQGAHAAHRRRLLRRAAVPAGRLAVEAEGLKEGLIALKAFAFGHWFTGRGAIALLLRDGWLKV